MDLTSIHNTDELLNAILMDNLEAILESVINGNYLYSEDTIEDYDRLVMIFVGSMIFVLARNSSSCGEAVSITELSDREDNCATVPKDATLEDAIQKGDDNFAELCWLVEAMQEDVVSSGIEPAKDTAVHQHSGEAAATGKRVPQRRNRFSGSP